MTVIVKCVDWEKLDICNLSYIEVAGDLPLPDLIIEAVDKICEFENGKVSFEVKGARVLQFKNKDAFSKIICI